MSPHVASLKTSSRHGPKIAQARRNQGSGQAKRMTGLTNEIWRQFEGLRPFGINRSMLGQM